ncbi:MAG: hypothetical protein RL032_1744, partial [Pseudomonadota bacterium]
MQATTLPPVSYPTLNGVARLTH